MRKTGGGWGEIATTPFPKSRAMMKLERFTVMLIASDLQALIDVARFNPEITEPMAVSYVVGICKDHQFDGGSF